MIKRRKSKEDRLEYPVQTKLTKSEMQQLEKLVKEKQATIASYLRRLICSSF